MSDAGQPEPGGTAFRVTRLEDGVSPVEDRSFPCPGCEYDLRGQEDPRCPECGFSADSFEVLREASEQAASILNRVLLARHRIAVVIGVGFLLGLILRRFPFLLGLGFLTFVLGFGQYLPPFLFGLGLRFSPFLCGFGQSFGLFLFGLG